MSIFYHFICHMSTLNSEVHTHTCQIFLKHRFRDRSIKRIEMFISQKFYLLENSKHKHHLIFFSKLETLPLIIYLCHFTVLKSACLQILQPSILFLIRTNFTRSFLAKKLSTTVNYSDTIQDDQTRVYRLCSINCQLNIIACFILIMQLSSF